jgi:GMC oxidoreductase
MDGWRVVEAQPGAGEIREDYLRASLLAYFHYAGTCAIGSVVDPELRVYSIDNLRVTDASDAVVGVGQHQRHGVRDRRACRRPARVNFRPAGPSYAM